MRITDLGEYLSGVFRPYDGDVPIGPLNHVATNLSDAMKGDKFSVLILFTESLQRGEDLKEMPAAEVITIVEADPADRKEMNDQAVILSIGGNQLITPEGDEFVNQLRGFFIALRTRLPIARRPEILEPLDEILVDASTKSPPDYSLLRLRHPSSVSAAKELFSTMPDQILITSRGVRSLPYNDLAIHAEEVQQSRGRG